jgi:putative ABC transport system ATP-binding protein
LLHLEGIRKTFNPGQPNEKVALTGIELALEPGEFAVVIGSNGAGKSTLLNVVAGDVSPDAGRVLIDGRDVTALPAHERGRFIGRVFQDTGACTAPGQSIEENLAIAAGRGRRRRLVSPIRGDARTRFRSALAPLGLGLEARLGTHVELLSGGQRQAVSLVMALLGEPKLLILDEHTAALARTGTTTLMVTHNMQQAIAYGERLVMLHEGKVLFEAAGAEKRGLTIEALVQRFGIVDDELLLA